MKRGLLWVPLVVFLGLFMVAGYALIKPADRTVRSAMVGRPVPEFSLPPMLPGKPGLDAAVFRQGKPRLLNVFASWCIPCAAEAGQLERLRAMGVPIDAVAIRDRPDDIRGFLARYGDPFERIGDDPESAVQLALGSAGVPETFVIDGQGKIILQHVGEIRDEDVPKILEAMGKSS
ncbi:DsbE family thiol:disulfide interchange protein [Sphingomonas sp. 28-62-11]|uniref:DsbE family thiol:disulfide interchange protein n=1 Tax=Sphingomonas sp. 28-62-11 TaxID=1970432 RepID=UPI000BCEC137|nr:MAG: alkyl hydroperoxide reductase [Sphingomonas sp. 28-62-11]